MSLVALGIRIATVRAIQAAIWPQFIVADSPADPFERLDDGKALIAVYTGHNVERTEAAGLLGGDPHVALAIQVFLPPVLTLAAPDGTPFTFDTRGTGAETISDAIVRRIFTALQGGFEPWSRLWMRLVTSTGRVANASYLCEKDKVKATAREVIVELSAINEPVVGGPAAGVWADFIAAMKAEPPGPDSLAGLGAWLAAEIAGPQVLSAAERDRLFLGLSIEAARGTGILPFEGAPPLAEVDVAHLDGELLAILAADPEAPAP